MYCINCGVKLADTEKACPLCSTVVCHPDFGNKTDRPLYPSNKMPKHSSGSKALCGAVIILFLIPLAVCLAADLLLDGSLSWFGYAAGALGLAYLWFALPMWFRKPNPVIFVPCGFAGAALYLLYISWVTEDTWFFPFALPITAGLCLIACTVVTLLRYLHRGKLYILGGAFMTLGAFMLLIEFLMKITFHLRFVGWSVYPLCGLFLLGFLLIYFAINHTAREAMERKLFF